MLDEYIKDQISSFFAYWKKRIQFIQNLIDQNYKENRHEIEVLIWAAFDALSNLWAESELGNKKSSQRVRFDTFLTNYGGEMFQLISLPDIWHRVEEGLVILQENKENKPEIKLSPEICEFLKYFDRPQLDYPNLKDLEFPWQRLNRQITDDVDLEDLLTQLLKNFSDLKDNEKKLRYWLRNSRYGCIAYKEMRSTYIHYGQSGNRTHGFEMSGYQTKPTYRSSIYSSVGSLGFSPQFMLSTLNRCIESFEQEARKQEIDPYPDYKSAIEFYFKKLLEDLLLYQFIPVNNEGLLEEIKGFREKLNYYLVNEKAREYLKAMNREFYLQTISFLKYEHDISVELSESNPYDLEKILQKEWLPAKDIQPIGELHYESNSD